MYQKIIFGKTDTKIAAFNEIFTKFIKLQRKIKYKINKQVFKYLIEVNLARLANKIKQLHKKN